MKHLPRTNMHIELWIIGLLVLSACSPAPGATGTAQVEPPQETVSTQTEGPTLAPEPTELSGPSFTNPVFNSDFPDPHIILANDMYYAYGTTNGSTVNIRVMRSPDLVNWEEL